MFQFFERLEALPTATTLAEYSSQDVVSKDRPIEEETPFGQFEFDDDEEIRAPYDSLETTSCDEYSARVVAVGSASSRSKGISFPLTSQMPYVPFSSQRNEAITLLTKEQLQHLKNELEQTKKDILNRFKDNDHFQLNVKLKMVIVFETV